MRRKRFFRGRRIRGADVKDITWLRSDGHEMTDVEWDARWVRSIGMRLDGRALGEVNVNGELISDDDLLMILNAYDQPVLFTIPLWDSETPWEVEFDTSKPTDDGLANRRAWSGTRGFLYSRTAGAQALTYALR